jgi:hypothetical protein
MTGECQTGKNMEEPVMPNMRYHITIFLEGTRKTMKTSVLDSRLIFEPKAT